MTNINIEVPNELYADFKVKLAQENKDTMEDKSIKDKIIGMIKSYVRDE